MKKPKKNTGNKDERLKPIESGSNKIPSPSAQGASGSPDSYGGSREGNIGHESNVETGRGDRQV